MNLIVLVNENGIPFAQRETKLKATYLKTSSTQLTIKIIKHDYALNVSKVFNSENDEDTYIHLPISESKIIKICKENKIDYVNQETSIKAIILLLEKTGIWQKI